MARTFIVSDRHNTFFTENNIKVGTQIPTEGTYRKGDIVVNNCEIITAIEVYFLVNNHVVSTAEDVVRCAFEKLGLTFIRMDNDAWCGEIKRRLYFTV